MAGIVEAAAFPVLACCGVAALCMAAAVAAPACAKRRGAPARTPTGGSPPRVWEWFCLGNVLAAGTFGVSVTYLLNFWIAHMRTHPPAFAFTQPLFALSLTGALVSMLYFFAFCGVAFIWADLNEAGRAAGGAVAAQQAAPGARGPRSAAGTTDTDVIVVGAGTAGAALATVLARDGKRVMLIERSWAQADRIVGELLQPGGVRALERMGLAAAAKCADTDCVQVDGYVCITPSTPPSADLLLSYPAADPGSLGEYFGLLGAADTRPVRVCTAYIAAAAAASKAAGPTAAASATARVGVTGSPAVASDVALTGRGGGGGGTAPPSAVCSVTGSDLEPRGRSFWNHRFVHQLRLAALGERGLSAHVGSVRGLVMGRDLVPGSGAAAALRASSLTAPPPPRFAGFDSHERPLAYTSAAAATAARAAAAGAPSPLRPSPLVAAMAAAIAVEADEVAGVRWVDEAGVERVTTSRLVVVADGMYSTMRAAVLGGAPDVPTASFFCGLVLSHAPGAAILPYPNRGHVVLADPNPVLLYQISSTQTRVLVDVPEPLFKKLNAEGGAEGGGLRGYFAARIAPQLPECVRPAFLAANASQEPQCMANKRLTAVPTSARGALLLGDSWNMRHPLTGGGMTVALKDAEMLAGCLRGLDLATATSAQLAAAGAAFQAGRAPHASTINVLANALHGVFTRPATDEQGTRGRLRAACIDYMSLGGANAAGPIGLLSGLAPAPGVLVTHFFAVAWHASKRALLPLPSPTRLAQGYDLLRVACVIILPLLEAERATLLAAPPVLAALDWVFAWRGTDLGGSGGGGV